MVCLEKLKQLGSPVVTLQLQHEHVSTLHCTAKHSTAQHGTAQHHIVQHNMVQHYHFKLGLRAASRVNSYRWSVPVASGVLAGDPGTAGVTDGDPGVAPTGVGDVTGLTPTGVMPG